MKKTFLNPKTVHAPISDYSHACIAESRKTLFIAGQVALDISGNLVGPGNMQAQVKQVLENLKAVLEAGGATFNNIVQTMTFLRNSDTVVQEFREARKALFPQYFTDGVYPPNTILLIPSLYREDLLLEFQATAVTD